MARGGDDSDEERHDRFRSERKSGAPKPLFTLGGGLKTSGEQRQTYNRRERLDIGKKSSDGRRRSYERDRSRSRRGSAERSNRRESKAWDSYEDRRRRRSKSTEAIERKERNRRDIKEPGSDDSRYRYYSGAQSLSDQRSDSFSSQDSQIRWNSRRSRSKGHERTKEDTFVLKFGGRRDLSGDDQPVVDDVEYRDVTPSPERSKSKKKKHESKNKKKEKKHHDKKKKKKCYHKDVDKESDKNDVSANDNVPASIRVESLLEKQEPAVAVKCGSTIPKSPPPKVEEMMPPPSSFSENLLPGNRPTDVAEEKTTTAKLKEDFYGPIVPPKLKKSTELSPEDDPATSTISPTIDLTEKAGDGSGTEQPTEPALRVYGPVLPERSSVAELADEDTSYGPALPPALTKAKTTDVDDECDDGSIFGPQPAGMGGRTLEELEIRAALIKKQLEIKEDAALGPKKRESWMTELPESRRAEFGFGPRKFRAREGPDLSADRSSWTDTPEMKKNKEELAKLGIDLTADDDNVDSRRLGIEERDKEMEKKARQGKKKKKKEKSLLEIHEKKLKKKKKKELDEKGGKEERRPFSREVDLQSNRFDEAQKRSIIKKAQLLDSRFSRGESKFL